VWPREPWSEDTEKTSNAGASAGKENAPPNATAGRFVDSPSADQCFFFSSFLVSDFFASVLVVPVVAVVAVVPVAPVIVEALVEVVDVAAVSVDVAIVDIVPVVPVAAVSVAIVEDVVVEVVMEVSVAAVSVLAFSCFLQPTAKIATATSAIRVITRDFFIGKFSSKICLPGERQGM